VSKIDFQYVNGIFSNPGIVLCIIIGTSLALRFYFFPFGVPLTLDSLYYFWYANDTSSLGWLPNGYSFANNGWSIFLAPFFSLIKLNSMISYMEMQRIIATIISISTTIPVYFLCRKFVENRFALFGALIFAFEPRIIQNSLFGLNDALYILLGTLALVLFLKNRRISTYISFAFIGFASLVRSEGLFLFFALSIAYFIRHRKSRGELLRYSILIIIFAAVILPLAILRIEMTGSDALTSRIVNEAIIASGSANNGSYVYAVNTITTFFGFLGRVMIPIFVFFVPVGVFLIFKNRTVEKTNIIVIMIVMSIPALYAYSVPALDTKYLYFLYPIFCVLAVLAMKKYVEVIRLQRTIFVIGIIIVLIGTIAFLGTKLTDRENQAEYFAISKFVIDNAQGVNEYYPENAYLTPAEMLREWPIRYIDYTERTKIISTEGFDSLDAYIESAKNNGLTHVVIDDKVDRPLFIKDIFLHEEKYLYLEKIFDSTEHGYKIHIKIFKINYDKIDSR